ncbi:MAG: hypothetical protein P8R37_08150 [Opitutae bacterium]|nr:hypothetical protein [Opitutae bacterium]MDG1301545.1 hypothetical protein [Opitutae bacterium]
MSLKNRVVTSLRKMWLAQLLCALTAGALTAATSKLESNSPFLPPGYSNKKPATPQPVTKVNGPLSRELEFRGIVQMKGIYEFSLFNKKLNRGYWIAENSSESGISVRNFDLDAMSISVTLNGRTEQLTLMTATDSPLPVAISTSTMPTKQPSPPNIPGLTPSTTKKQPTSRVIPRRRVILPKKK